MEFLADIHTKVIHFPIAFLISYSVVEFIYLINQKDFFNKAAFLFLIVGVIGSVISVLSGNQAFELVKEWSDQSRNYFSEHQMYANITVWYYTALLFCRLFLFQKKRLTRFIVLILVILSLFGSYFVFQTGYFGGKFAHQNVTITTLDDENIQ
jgi:uncharacterized membrane protein